MKNFLLAAIAAVAITSCTWVQLTAEGENVSLVGVDRIGNCERVGRATSKTLGSNPSLITGSKILVSITARDSTETDPQLD